MGEDHEKRDRLSEPRPRPAVASFSKRYLLKNLLRYLKDLKDPDRVRAFLQRLEADEFLVSQVQQPDGFEDAAHQLERYVLPAVVRIGDWQRYVRYLLTAISLRRLGRSFDDPTILQALARSGRLPLAEALVARLPSEPDRARGWAALAAVCPPSLSDFGRLVDSLKGELDRMPMEPGGRLRASMEPWCDALARAARLLAPRLRARWSDWIVGLAPWRELADRARLAVAEGFFDAGEVEADELWEALGTIEDPDVLLEFLPERLTGTASTQVLHEIDVLRTRLPRVAGDPSLLWAVALALLAGRDGNPTRIWRRLRGVLDPPAWDAKLLDKGAAVWPRLDDADLKALVAELSDPVSSARLWVLVLEGRRDTPAYRATVAALSALAEVTSVEIRRPLELRALRVAPPALASEVRSVVRGMTAALADVQYAVPASELASSLDLIAVHTPRRLRPILERALAAPTSDARILREVAAACTEERLLRELLERAETYAATAAADAAEGFELREEILSGVACRLLEAGGGSDLLDQVAVRLLPDEEDRLRVRAARILAGREVEPDRRAAVSVCSAIRDPLLALRVQVEILPAGEDRDKLVAPVALYRAAAGWRSVEDRLLALRGLLELPRKPASLAQERFGEIHSLGRRVEVLADLARHALAFEMRSAPVNRQDRRAAVLPLKEALGVVESDRWLAGLTPELVSIGAHLGAREAVAETQEAFERVSELETIPEEVRVAILVEVLTGAVDLLLSEASGAPLAHVGRSERHRRVRDLVSWLARAPEREGDQAVSGFLLRNWHRLLPVVTPVGERLERTAGSRRPPVPWLAPFWPDARPILERSAQFARSRVPSARAVFDLCLASPVARQALAAEILRPRGGPHEPHDPHDPSALHALAWLLVDGSPEQVPKILGRMAPGATRDRAVLEILRCASLPASTAQVLVGLLSSEDKAEEWGTLWLGLRHPEVMPEGEWVAATATLIEEGRLDPSDPATIPVRRRLWRLDLEESTRALAEASIRSLAVGGGAAGERAACLFLEARVRPVLGQSAPAEALASFERMKSALEEARRLGNGPEPPAGSVEVPGPGSSDSDGLLKKFRRWSGTWSRRALRLDSQPLGQVSALTVLTGMAAIPVLPQLQAVALQMQDAPGADLRAVPWALAALGLLVVANGLVIGSYLDWATPGDRTVRWPVRRLRTVLASIPILGLWTIPLWRWLIHSKERWVRGGREPHGGSLFDARRPVLELPFDGWADRFGRRVSRQAVMVGLYLSNVAVVAVALRLLSEVQGLRRTLVIGAAVAQILFFSIMLTGLVLWVGKLQLRGWQRYTLPVLSVCWLIPFPVLPVLGIGSLAFIDVDRARGTVARAAFSEVRGLRRLQGWLRLEGRLRRGWRRVDWRDRILGVPPSALVEPERSDRDKRLLWLFQGKGAALFFEAALLADGLWRLAKVWGPTSVSTLEAAFAILATVLLLGILVSLARLAIAFVRVILQPELARNVFGPRLFWGHWLGVQAALLFGLQLGAGIATGDVARIGGALVFLGLAGAVLQVGALLVGLLLRSVPERWRDDQNEMVLKTLVYAGAGILGVSLGAERSAGLDLLPILGVYRFAMPLFGSILGSFGLRWLREKEGRAGDREVAAFWRERLGAKMLAVTAIAPFGGLAIPWWIRREQRRSR